MTDHRKAKAICWISVCAFLWVLLYYGIALLGQNVYPNVLLIRHFSLLNTIFLDAVFVVIAIFLLKKLPTQYYYPFLFFTLSAAICIVMRINLIAEHFNHFHLPYAVFRYPATLCQIVAAWLLLKGLIRNRRHKKMLVTAIPFVLSSLCMVVVFAFTFVDHTKVMALGLYSIISVLLLMVVFVLMIVNLAAVKRSPMMLFIVSYLMITIADIFYGHYVEAALLDNLGYWAFLLIVGRVLLLASVLAILFYEVKQEGVSWFNEIDSQKTQIILWCNSLVSLFFIFSVLYYFMISNPSVPETLTLSHSLNIFLPYLVAASLVSQFFTYYMDRPFRRIESMVDNYIRDQASAHFEKTKEINIKEFRTLGYHLSGNFSEIKNKTAVGRKMFDVASKAAHDINSPLAVLSTVAGEVKEKMPSETEQVFDDAIDQIQQISEDLLNQYRTAFGKLEQRAERRVSYYSFVSIILSNLVKQLNIRHKNLQLDIQLQIGDKAQHCLTLIDPVQLKRFMTILCNNAIEASNPADAVNIQIILQMDESSFYLSVKDFGCGMTAEQIAAIQSMSAKTTKEKGSGIGLRYAVSKISEWGGQYEIQSKPNEGATFLVSLPLPPMPTWWLYELILYPNAEIILFDDEPRYFAELEHIFNYYRDTMKLTVSYCNTIKEFRQAVANACQRAVFFVDHHFAGSNSTGLDYIYELQLANRAVLLTNQYNDYFVQKKCEEQRVKLLPKPLFKHLLLLSKPPGEGAERESIR